VIEMADSKDSYVIQVHGVVRTHLGASERVLQRKCVG